MASPMTLLKNGTVLLHDDSDKVSAVKSDILIKGNTIFEIAPNISSTEDGIELVDCTNRIISPGFIDTHHHVWQTPLKGHHADQLLIDYMPIGSWQSSNFSDDDFFWGQLGGCLEALWAGTTTMLDHSHINVRKATSKAALSATISSGIRSIYGYCPTPAITNWNPIKFDDGFLTPWVLELFEELAMASPYANGRVEIGLAFDLYFLPEQVVQSVFAKAEELGIRIITSHYVRNAQFGLHSVPQMLEKYGLLDANIVLSHANGATDEDVALLKKRNAYFSSTPSTEMQMALGRPICFDADAQPHASLGIDCHSNQLGSIVSEMRLGLQFARAEYNQRFIEHDKAPRTMYKTVNEAFNLGTIQGARALKMDKSIGSLKPEKLADLVIFDATSPSMVVAAQQDPVAAVVLHSSPGDILGVMVDGIWRKRDGSSASVLQDRDETARQYAGTDRYEWQDVADKLVQSRKNIQAKMDKIDFVQAREQVFATFNIDKKNIVDTV